MKNPMIAAAVALLCAGAFADTFYVDPTGGTVSSDDYDGSAETWQGGTVGPKKTLAAVAAEAAKVATKSNPCTIIALPGEYKEGVSNPDKKNTATTLNRVAIPAYVTLQSRDGAGKTFIVGAESDAPNASTGCGTNAVRCASLNANGKIIGFTLTGGHTFSDGGGAASSGTIVDCVVSNNVSKGRGGGTTSTVAYRCRFISNTTLDSASAMYYGAAYECYFTQCNTYQTPTYQCTFGSGAYVRAEHHYNDIFAGPNEKYCNTPTYHHCYLSFTPNPYSSPVVDSDCVITNLAALVVGADGKLGKGSVAIDAGRADYLSKVTAAYRDVDLYKGQRVYNGAVDVGCCEYDPRGDYTDTLCVQDGAMEVTAATPMVIGAENSVLIGTNQTLSATLLKNGDAATTAWAFYAMVEGAGTLELYFGDEATSSQTVTAADGKKRIDYSAADSTALRLVYAGEDGAAAVSRFCNRTEVTIEAASAGVAITGDITEAGTYAVPAGETRTFKIARSNETTKFVSGVEVNGELFNFYDYPNGKEFAIDGDDVLSSVSIKVVYDDDAKELFVDRVNGSDANCGLYTNLAFQSLAKAASVAKANWTILALPGIYDNEVSNPEKIGTATTLNRVTLPADVTLRAVGTVDETVIMGAASDAPNADTGCGTNAVRCVNMGSGAKVVGMTISGGRCFSNATGGGAYGGSAIDCVFTNNCAYRGGGISGATCHRCLFVNNKTTYTGAAAYDSTICNSLFLNCDPYNGNTYNCTFAPGSAYARGGNHYNAVVAGSNEKYCNGPKYHHCYLSFTPNSYSSPVVDSDCVITNLAALAVGADGKLGKGSVAIDAGRVDYFEKIAVAYRDLDAFGGQRVYNGTVDVGCGEYDWRGDFAKTLAKKGVAVEVATANVTTNFEAGLDVPAGESLKLKLVLKTDGKVSFKVVAEDGAVLAVTVGGEPVMPDEFGKVEFEALAGETEVEIAVTGEGQATVSDVVLPKRGALLLIR